MNPKRKGEIVEFEVIKRLLERGYDVYSAETEDTRIDLIVASENGLERIQVKKGRIEDGSIVFQCSSRQSNANKDVRKDYHGEIDYFIVYSEENDSMYKVPVEETGKTSMRLRIEDVSRETSRINWASEYRIE